MQFFLKKYNEAYGKSISGLTRRAQSVLLRHPWPGNVRELENVISSACITATSEFIDVADLPEHLHNRIVPSAAGESWKHLSLDEMLMIHIKRMLGVCKGDKRQTAEVLGIGRTTLYRYLRRNNPQSADLKKS